MKALLRFAFASLLLAAGTVSAAAIKIATVAPEGSAWMKQMRATAAAVKERTAGRVELKFYPAGVMGNDAAVLRKIKLGQLQGGAFTGAEASLVYKDAPIYSVPFLLRDQGEADFIRGKLDPMVFKGFADAGYTVAGLSGGGFAYLMSTHPIRTRDELRASKVWVPQSDKLAEKAYEAGGVSPIPLPLTDVYPGLQTGLVDTVANTEAGSIFFQWHTKVKYLVDLPLTYVVGLMLIDSKALAKLEPADRDALLEEVKKGFASIDAAQRGDNEAARATLVKQGIQVITPSPEEAKFWREIGEKAQEKLVSDGAVSAEAMAAARAALAEYRAKGAGSAP
ncbi:MAG TPA: TRAP transporter substrate-binding protein DctP [Xanthomonadales bacterium]|nr:TRAP transporter substrate-binding protein DctP [Xanthomonadales bacterium]